LEKKGMNMWNKINGNENKWVSEEDRELAKG